ncbi:MAG TPA: phage tail protein [Stellaceae bacterium]|jgi:hypothetical protein|nr:phage tail protein [Stellaceae bacterium]
MGGGARPFTNAFSSLPTASLRYNTSQAGSPVVIGYGTQRLAINLLEGFGFNGGNGKGGKGGGGGGGGGGKKTGDVNYTVNVAMAICQGPAAVTAAGGAFNRVWSNGGISLFNLVGMNFYDGVDGQAADPVFLSEDPNSPVIGYSGTGYVTGTPLDLGQTPALPNVSFEMSMLGSAGWWASFSTTEYAPGNGLACPTIPGLSFSGCGPSYPADCNPALIILDLLANPRYGAGFPAENIDIAGTLSTFGSYCQAAQLAMSLLLNRSQAAGSWLQQICELTVAAPVWSGAMLKIVPYWLTDLSGNGASWSPSLAVQYSVDDDDYVAWQGDARSSTDTGSDPVVMTRNDPAQITNWMSLEYYDTINSYNPNVVDYFDQGAIDNYGARTEPSKEAHCFTNPGSTYTSGYMQVSRGQWNRNTFKFQLPWRFCLLEPMDVIEITDPGIGLTTPTPVRITQIDEDDNGELQITAEGLPGASSSAPVFAGGNSAGAPLNLYADPGNANAPIIFEPPPGLSGGTDEVVIGTSGGDQWGGAQVWVSTDGSTYRQIGSIYGDCRQGVLAAPLGTFAGANPDTSDTLQVNLTESGGQLVSASSGDAASNVTLSYCDGELISYETATLTGTARYSLTTLYRGAYGSAISAHANGSPFAYIGLPLGGPGILVYDYPSNLIGKTLFVKLLSFNLFGQQVQELSSVTAYDYLLNGSGSGNFLSLLAAGNNEDLGIVGTSIIAEANLGVVTDTLAGDIDLGLLP